MLDGVTRVSFADKTDDYIKKTQEGENQND
jgi:hypothetical protein